MTPTDRPSKREAFTAFLEDGWVSLYIDARRPGVVVPQHLRQEARLVLQYGLNMPVPVDDLELTDEGVKATLSFARQPCATLIPWTAIYVIACTDGRGVLYQEDVPEELVGDAEPGFDTRPKAVAAAPALAMAPDSPSTLTAVAEEPPESPRARLKSVPMSDPARNVGPGSDEPAAPRGRPALRLVKP